MNFNIHDVKNYNTAHLLAHSVALLSIDDEKPVASPHFNMQSGLFVLEFGQTDTAYER